MERGKKKKRKGRREKMKKIYKGRKREERDPCTHKINIYTPKKTLIKLIQPIKKNRKRLGKRGTKKI
jgi:hypothetical protein